MNHMLIVIKYKQHGWPPVITSAVVPIQCHMSFERHKQEILEQYRTKPDYEVTITEF